MNEEEKKLLKEDVELAKENNKLLNKLVWHQRWSSWLNALKWVVIIGSTLGALYYLQPMLDSLWGTYSELLSAISDTSIKTLPGR